jgi:uncharacterized protein (TIGR00369 family)
MRDFIVSSPFSALLGVQAEKLERDLAVLVLPERRDLVTLPGVVHGGALATLIDTAGMAAAWCTDQLPPSMKGSTAALTVSYLAPAAGTVRAEARVLKRGKTIVTVDVDASSDAGPVARGLVTYKLG